VALMLPASAGVSKPAELAGQKIGLPGFFGANFVGWKALVYATGLSEDAVAVEDIGFTQAAAMQQETVDGAMVYIANEPIQLRNQGLEVTVFPVSDYIDLVSNGLVVGEKLQNDNPDLIRRMVRATLRGIQYAVENPDETFEIVRETIPEMTDEDAPIQRQVLDASIELWRSDRPGVSDQAAWQESVDFMVQSGLLEEPVAVDTLYTNHFVEGQ